MKSGQDDMRIQRIAALVFEQHVIRTGGIEGRVQVNQVHRVGGHAAQDGEVVTKIKGIGHDPPELLFIDNTIITK